MFRKLVNLGYNIGVIARAEFQDLPALSQVLSGARINDYLETCLLEIDRGIYSNKFFRRCLEIGVEKVKKDIESRNWVRNLSAAFNMDLSHYSSIDDLLSDLREGKEVRFHTFYGEPRDLVIKGIS